MPDVAEPSFRSFAIVPAAGRSVRMGRPKLLLPWGEWTVIEQVLAAWLGSRVTRTLVVVRADDVRLAEVCRNCGAAVVTADPPPPDMKASVRCALEHIAGHWQPAPHDAWLVAPADLPRLATATIDRVLAAYDSTQPEIVAPRIAGLRGHPVLFPWSLAAEVARLPSDVGIDELLRRYPVRDVPVDASADSAADLDTPEDYRRLRP